LQLLEEITRIFLLFILIIKNNIYIYITIINIKKNKKPDILIFIIYIDDYPLFNLGIITSNKKKK